MKIPIQNVAVEQREIVELTLRGIILGALITVIFTASNVYLGLKVGPTFSSAIPSAVISMAVLRAFSGSTLLENNMVQTQASAAGTLTSVIFVIPGLLMVGHWQGFPFWQTFGICAAGGLLGVLFTIPLRHAMVVESDLPYPEGVAAAEILRVGDRRREPTEQLEQREQAVDGVRDVKPANNGTGVADIAVGSGVAALVSLATSGLRILSDGASLWTHVGLSIFRFPMGFSTALLGAGYLMGLVPGLATLLGVFLAWGVAIPILSAHVPLAAGQSMMALATQLWAKDVRFIGAGMLGVAAIWTLITLLGPVVRGVRRTLMGSAGRLVDGVVPRTERDLPMRWMIIVAMVVVAMLVMTFKAFLTGVPQTSGQIWTLVGSGVLFAFIFGFLISAACGYMAGLIGSSSSPISGIGIIGTILVAVLLMASSAETGLLQDAAGIKLAIAFTLFVTSAVVSVAAISNDNLQDLKTGWLVGATPWKQQVALLIGVVIGALVIPPILNLLYHAFGFPDAMPRAGMDASQALSAPQATLMQSIATGIFTHQLNWAMLKIGAAGAVVLILVDGWLKKRGGKIGRLPVIATGVGIYLPPEVSMPLAAGAILSWVIERHLRRGAARAGMSLDSYAEIPRRRATLIASGLIVGESLFGVLMAAIIGISGYDTPLAIVGAGFGPTSELLGTVVFAGVAFFFWKRVTRAH